MNCSTPGLPVHHQLPEFTQTHIHRVSDAMQPSHPLSSPSPPAPNPSQHQSLFQWVNSSHEVARVLEFQLQHQSFQWTPRADLLQNGLVRSPCSPRDSQESSPTPQFKSDNKERLSQRKQGWMRVRIGINCVMSTHSSVLAWRIPGTGEPGGLPSMGSHRVRHDWSDLAAAAAASCQSLEFTSRQ